MSKMVQAPRSPPPRPFRLAQNPTSPSRTAVHEVGSKVRDLHKAYFVGFEDPTAG